MLHDPTGSRLICREGWDGHLASYSVSQLQLHLQLGTKVIIPQTVRAIQLIFLHGMSGCCRCSGMYVKINTKVIFILSGCPVQPSLAQLSTKLRMHISRPDGDMVDK